MTGYTQNTKSAFVALTGRPNVGKSSLLNRMLGQKVAIVSPKPQTTRNRITGVLTQDEVQLVFFDTPGLHTPKTKLGEFMVSQVNSSVADVDMAVLIVEPLGPLGSAELGLLQRFGEQKMPAMAVINKIDLIKHKSQLIEKMALLSEQYEFQEIIPLSALTGEGVDILLQKLSEAAQPGPHYFPEDTLTEQPERVIAAEIVREKLLYHMMEEIPHGTAVEIESFKEKTGKRELLEIGALIYCEKASHKGMIIGKQGQMLKKIATEARQDLERFFGVQVHLQCWVKVKEGWRNSNYLLKDFGFTER